MHTLYQLTDLSSDTSPESHRRFSSASLFGHQDAESKTENTHDSNYQDCSKTNSAVSPRKHSTVSDRKSLQIDAVRISLTQRRPVKREMGRQELEKLLTTAHNDLDKLVQYTMASCSISVICGGCIVGHVIYMLL